MDRNLVFAKTPIGDEAVRQSTRVVQRNLRMVLVQVDGKMSVADLTSKIGNPRLVESALRELEEGGYIAPSAEANVRASEKITNVASIGAEQIDLSAMSQFSTFGQKSLGASDFVKSDSVARNFSSFGKPILPSSSEPKGEIILPNSAASEKRKPTPEYRSHTHRTSFGRIAMLAAFGLLGILCSIVFFYPYDRFKPAIELATSQLLKVPVKIDLVGVNLFPTPHLKLSGVRIGESSDSTIAEIRIASPINLLGNRPYQIPLATVSGADISANLIVELPMFVGTRSDDSIVVIRKIEIENSHISLGEDLASGDLNGKLVFGTDGLIENAVFETVDRTLAIDARPGNQGISLNIEGRAWQPAGTSVSFASMQAKGVLRKGKLLIQNIDTTFLGGILRGNWVLEWSNGLAMAGDATLSRVDTRKVSSAFAQSLKIDGDMSGTIRMRSNGPDWHSLWRNTEATLNTEIVRGVFHGVDLGEASRRSGLSEVRAGATKFDRLRSTINITPKQIVGRDLRMDAGMMTASGQFVTTRNGQVDGNMSVTMQTSVSTQNATIHIFGNLPDLSATSRK